MKITFNAPFTLLFTLASVAVFFMFGTSRSMQELFILDGIAHPDNWKWYFSLFGYTMGHASLQHLLGNLSIILLLGPILEERYGTKMLLIMVSVTGMLTALIHVLLYDQGLLGASGIVFMFIVLSSLMNIKGKEVPVTFLLIVLLFLGQEILSSFDKDNISQFAHIAGGITGMFFGFYLKRA